MQRIKKTFDKLKQENRAGLVTFITAGDGEASLDILLSLPNTGADIIELGMPFTDPQADGPIIQAASERALKAGHTMQKTFAMAKAFRNIHPEVPLILMGYYNPILAFGIENFLQNAQQAGIDGLIVVDLPPEEDHVLKSFANEKHISLIRLATPTTDEKRMPVVLKDAEAFIYYVALTGITGTKTADPQLIAPKIKTLKEHTNLPIATGFGIKTPEQAAAIGEFSDAVVVGSLLVDIIGKAQENNENVEVTINKVCDTVTKLATALKGRL